MNQHTPQGMVNLPMYSNELGRMPLGGDSNLLPSLSSSHMHSRIPHHQHQQQQHHQQAVQPGHWYSFQPSQLTQGMSNTLATENHLVTPAGPGTGIGTSNIGGGISGFGSTYLEGNNSGIPPASTSEADFIFGQLAMGYPMAFANDLQTATLSQMLEMGMSSGGAGGGGSGGSGGCDVGGASEPGGQGMHRYNTNVGRGAGGECMGGESCTTSPGYLDNDTMNMQWPGPSTGFQ